MTQANHDPNVATSAAPGGATSCTTGTVVVATVPVHAAAAERSWNVFGFSKTTIRHQNVDDDSYLERPAVMIDP